MSSNRTSPPVLRELCKTRQTLTVRRQSQIPRKVTVLLRIHKRYEFDAPPASFVEFELIDLNCENHFVVIRIKFQIIRIHFAPPAS